MITLCSLRLFAVLFLVSLIEAATYTTITSKFNNDTIRVKSWERENTDLCKGNTTHHTGWADISDHHLFFWFHEARHNPKDAPLMVWLQGGPGGSSMAGLLMEHGPCLINGSESTKFNPYSWTEDFNIIYLDQPAGSGNSYIDDVHNTTAYPEHSEAAGLDVVAFLKVFYEAFPDFAQAPLHLAGESYAGRYVPVFASTIIEYNTFFQQNSYEQIPLRSIMVGNGWTSPRHGLPSIHEVGCSSFRQYEPYFNSSTCAKMALEVVNCEIMLAACEESQQYTICTRAGQICDIHIQEPMMQEDHSYYDRRVACPPGQCFPDADDTVAFMNSPKIFNGLLEVGKQSGGRVEKFDFINKSIFNRFNASTDLWTSSSGALKHILTASAQGQQKVDVLYYNGMADIICNGAGVLATLRGIFWEKRAQFRASEWQELPWTTLDGGRAGRSKMTDGLWFVEIEEAGHMAPRDQPVSTLNMVQSWLSYIETGKIPNFSVHHKFEPTENERLVGLRVQAPGR